jgi:uncharacterized membrane protein YozB (DUF420 family)
MSKKPHRAGAAVRRPAAAAAPPMPPVYRYGLQLFTVFAVAMLVAFWPSYYSRLSSQDSIHPHTHGLTMSVWVALLLGQAWLIRRGERPTHRKFGLLSYVAVPALVVAAVNFLHYRVAEVPDLNESALFFVTLVLGALASFLVLFGLAMWYRKQPALHARFMIATLFPLFTPVTDRLIGRYAPSLIVPIPVIDGFPVVQTTGFLLADVIVIGLSVWDWKTNNRRVFPVALGVLVAYHAAVLTFHRFGFWQAFAAWFVGLPLS